MTTAPGTGMHEWLFAHDCHSVKTYTVSFYFYEGGLQIWLSQGSRWTGVSTQLGVLIRARHLSWMLVGGVPAVGAHISG